MKRVLHNFGLSVCIALLAIPTAFGAADAAPAADTHTPYAAMTSFTLEPAVLPPLSLGPENNTLYRLGQIDNNFLLIDGLSLYAGLNIDVAGVIDGYAKGLYGGLFAGGSTLYSPYLSLSNGASYAGVRLMLADGLRFDFGQAYRRAGLDPTGGFTSLSAWSALGGGPLPFDRRSFDTVLAGMSWDFAKWGAINLTASQTTERGTLALGTPAGGRQIAALGVSAHVDFGSGWVTTVSYNQANKQLSLKPIGGLSDSALRSQSYGIAVAKHGLFGHDALGLSLSRPAGYGTIPDDMQFQFYGRDKLFANNTPATDIELGYVTTLLDGPLALQANASYQVNYNGMNKDSVAFMSRAKIKF